MKRLFPFLLVFFATVSCLKDDSSSNNRWEISVEQYIEVLKSNNFDLWEIPIFEISDIPKLLEYARDEQIITIAMGNPYSSTFPAKMNVSLGMMVLWTIEGTRLDVDYPSPIPVVRDGYGNTQRTVPLSEAAGLYEQWWEQNKDESVARLKEISPFEGTNLRWY